MYIEVSDVFPSLPFDMVFNLAELVYFALEMLFYDLFGVVYILELRYRSYLFYAYEISSVELCHMRFDRLSRNSSFVRYGGKILLALE